MIYGTGVDITEVGRLRRAVEKWGESFLNRIFTQDELKAARKRATMFQHLAGRFAAKEAVFKAMGEKDLAFKDFEILNDPDGKPVCKVVRGKKAKGVDILVSISHVKNYAVASAIVTKKG
ncbi:MAG: holo-ACP synthase [Deltaproteobacteria bacterium]